MSAVLVTTITCCRSTVTSRAALRCIICWLGRCFVGITQEQQRKGQHGDKENPSSVHLRPPKKVFSTSMRFYFFCKHVHDQDVATSLLYFLRNVAREWAQKSRRRNLSGGPADIRQGKVLQPRCSASQGFPWFALRQRINC